MWRLFRLFYVGDFVVGFFVAWFAFDGCGAGGVGDFVAVGEGVFDLGGSRGFAVLGFGVMGVCMHS